MGLHNAILCNDQHSLLCFVGFVLNVQNDL